jgi:uncharacterized protein (DUF1499 family)
MVVMPILACSGKRPATLGISGGRLTACPSTPNCVSSDASDPAQRVDAFALPEAIGPAAWQHFATAVAALPRTRIVEATDDYLHAECSSAIFGFVDDLELHLRPDSQYVAVRSASRLGYSDLGVNRRRIEQLRKILRDRGLTT